MGMTREALTRIVVLLLALADLAERAAGASYPARRQALWWLHQAHATAMDFVASPECDAADDPCLPALTTLRYGSDPADAMALALSLRTLALVVQTIAANIHHEPVESSDDYSIDGQLQQNVQAIAQIAWHAANAQVGQLDTS